MAKAYQIPSEYPKTPSTGLGLGVGRKNLSMMHDTPHIDRPKMPKVEAGVHYVMPHIAHSPNSYGRK